MATGSSEYYCVETPLQHILCRFYVSMCLALCVSGAHQPNNGVKGVGGTVQLGDVLEHI